MKNRSFSLIFIIFVLFSQFAFAEVKILSPLEGTWGNKQMLVIDDSDSGDYYYSVDGSDPEKFGFAYDGPVLLDIGGDVNLKVVRYGLDGSKDFNDVQYSVVTNIGFNKPYEDFLFTFLGSGYYDYNFEGGLTIPESLTFSLEDYPENFITGMDLSIASDSAITQFVPCTIWDNTTGVKWRFYIKTEPQIAGIFGKREVPFEITDWETITFTKDDFIYKIDSDYWGQPEEDVILDRSVPHTISWQSINYKLGNTVESVVLPPKPEIAYEAREDGSGFFYIKGDYPVGDFLEEPLGIPDISEQEDYCYSLSVITGNEEKSPEQFDKIGIDCFYGDSIKGTLALGVYSDSIYQGQIFVDYHIDKLPPKSPVINTSAKTFYSRNSVDIDVAAGDDSELYIAICEPYILEDSDVVYKPDSSIFETVPLGEFSYYPEGVYSNTLKSEDDKVIYYKIVACCKKGNMKSAVTEYSVIVDKSSYYFDQTAVDSLGEGTLLNPFTTFDQCIEEFKDIRSVSLRIKGDLIIDKKYHINSNMQILNGGEGRIIFGPEGSFEMDGSSLGISDCRIHKIPSPDVVLIVPFFKLNRGSLELHNCQVSGDFERNATIIDSVSSIITIDNSIVSVSADSYASFISSIKSKLSIIDSSISIASDTSVIISASGGDLNIQNNKFTITGSIGRIAELFGADCKFIGNEFRADLYNQSRSVSPIFSNKSTKLLEEDNIEIGF